MDNDTTAKIRLRPLRKRQKTTIDTTKISSNNTAANKDGKELAKARRIKYRQKQERTKSRLAEERQKKDWIEANGGRCRWIDLKDVIRIRRRRCRNSDVGGRVAGGDGDTVVCHSGGIDGAIDSRSLPGSCSEPQDYAGTRYLTDIDDDGNVSSGVCPKHNDRDKDNDSAMTMMTAQGRDDDAMDDEEEWMRLCKWVEPYLDLKDTVTPSISRIDKEVTSIAGRGLGCNTVPERYFIAEGTETVRLLIQHCAESSPKDHHDHQRDNRNADELGIGEGEDRIRILSIMSKPGAFFDGPVNLLADIKRSFPSTTTKNNDNKQDDSIIPIDRKITNKMVTQKEDQITKNLTEMTKVTTSPPFQIIIGSQETLSHVVGFPLSRGAMAIGIVPQRDESWLYNYLSHHSQTQDTTPPQTPAPPLTPIRILAIDRLADTANLGSLLRTAAAFGITAVILSDDSCDAWYRRCVRVSMGHVVSVPSVRVADLAATLGVLEGRFGVRCHAAVVDDGGGGADRDRGGGGGGARSVVLEDVGRGEIGARWCCVVGNEADGVSEKVLGVCQRRVTIGMVDGVDSLSVGVAAGILLHGMREREERL